MARIRSRNTCPEKLLRSALWQEGLRYRVHYRTSVGRPDLVFVRQQIAVFIDGCFWHGCPDHYVYPRTRRDFWAAKLLANVTRDQRQTKELEECGWVVLRFWEHEVYAALSRVVREVGDTVANPVRPVRSSWRLERVKLIDESSDLERRYLVTLEKPVRRRVEEKIRTTTKVRPPS